MDYQSVKCPFYDNRATDVLWPCWSRLIGFNAEISNAMTSRMLIVFLNFLPVFYTFCCVFCCFYYTASIQPAKKNSRHLQKGDGCFALYGLNGYHPGSGSDFTGCFPCDYCFFADNCQYWSDTSGG